MVAEWKEVSDYNCFLHLEEKQQKLHNSDNTLNQTPNAYNAVSTLNIVTSAEANFVAGCQDYILLARATVIIKASDAHQVKAELTSTEAHLPALHVLPIKDDILIELCKRTNVYVVVIMNEVILKFKLPLLVQQFFDVFILVPVATVKIASADGDRREILSQLLPPEQNFHYFPSTIPLQFTLLPASDNKLKAKLKVKFGDH
uniref:Uncharacterized protein n=1 Tax=Glossina palpalis gambiensis TaxID=67801 RepID=A0A1B0BM73_9MUSC